MLSNIFIQLLKKVAEKNWCTNIFCTTCGCMHFRQEIKLIGAEALVKAMYEVNAIEVYQLHNWMHCTELVYFDLNPLFHSKTKNDLPEFVQEMIRIQDARYEERRVQLAANTEEERIRKEEAAVRKDKVQQQFLERKQKNTIIRDTIVKDFLSHPLESQLEIIAVDQIHFPDYYPLDIKTISAETIANLDKKLLTALIKRFSKLKRREWKQFYNRLLCVMHRRTTLYTWIGPN